MTLPNYLWELLNLIVFTCPVNNAATLRAAANVPVYRYRYFGDFFNLRLYNGSGAYHSGELGVEFGTSQDVTGIAPTLQEALVSQYMQKAWATFAKDPVNGLPSLGWPQFNPTADTLIRLAYPCEAEASYVSPTQYDYACQPLMPLVSAIKASQSSNFTSSTSILDWLPLIEPEISPAIKALVANSSAEPESACSQD